MNTKKLQLQKILKQNTSSLDDVFKNLTPEQEKIVEDEIRYYDVLVELRNLRKQKGLTQAQLAIKASVPRTTITKIESGNYNPTINTLMSIASAMDKKLQVQFL
jgi:DNA-binding XRE family transcriptional regulator